MCIRIVIGKVHTTIILKYIYELHIYKKYSVCFIRYAPLPVLSFAQSETVSPPQLVQLAISHPGVPSDDVTHNQTLIRNSERIAWRKHELVGINNPSSLV